MDAPVSAFLGATGPLIRKLEVLLLNTSEDDPKRWPRLPKGVRDGIDHLKDDLEEISTYLEDLSELDDPPLTAKCWMKEVRELSYDMEDYIDSLARHSCRTNIKTRSVCKISHVEVNRLPRRKKVAWHKQVITNISEFRIRVQDANQRHKRYGLDCLNFRRRYASSGPMLPRQHDEAADLVIDGQMSGFMDTLACDGDHQLKVVSIVGTGGLGKTTFARTLYNKIRGQFDCRAYVSMTRKPNIKKVLRDILTQVRREEARDHCEDVDITGRITKHLLGKRYLIVTDDLWAASAWNVISRAFPEGTQRSRIVVTTQVVDVALTCCCYQPELVFEMKPLDVYHSRKLFFNKIFGSESDCPEMFKEISCKIVDRCGGSPLATSNMASLLASHSVLLMEQWAYISDSLSTMLRRSSTSEGLRLVLNLSYNNLSHHLKSCLLYLTKYPEGCIICTDDLVKQWVAEGFIEATEGRDVESVARSYFDELIDRRFIQPARIKYNGEIVSCTVHDTVYDLIAYNSAEENFVMVVDTDRKNVELSDKVRRLSLNFGDAISAKKPRNISSSHVRSLAFSGFFACMPSIAEFKLLRVLNLQLSGHRGEDILDLTGISELFQLRYLKVVSGVCIELPKHMRGLQHLETLDMDAEVTAVPWDIIHLPCLWHLHLPLETNLMDWISDMRSDIVRRLDKLTNMRDLRVTCSTEAPNHLKKNMEALGSLLRGLGNLEMLALVPGSSHGNAVVRGPSEVVVVSWDGFTPPLHLKRFEWSLCSCIFSRVPKWAGEFGNLCVLKIMVKELFGDGVDILKGLPALTALSLYVHAATVERIVFDKAGFLALKFFKFRCSGVPWLKFEAGAMPNLLKLKLGFNANRVDQHRNTHIIIEHLPSLKQIYAKIGGASAAAESALRATVINHPSNPSINIQWVDWMFFGHEGRSRATEDKEQADIVEETAEEVSWEHAKKQANIRISTPSVTPSYLQVSDIQQILKEAQHRWLRPAEICEILKSYRNFRIAPEPPNRPPSGSLFLFDREKLRYFWKDGHNWRKKNDQQTVKEAYEKLKSGSVDVIYCNYAHDEENISFQRRTYSVLEENFRHIVLVHYRDTKFSTATADISAMENSFPQNDDGSVEAAIDYAFLKTQSSSQSDILKDSIKESDSFTRWMCKELSDVDDSQIQSSFGIFEASSCEPLDQFSVAPMVSQSQDQLFSSVDFAPSWTYLGSKTKAPPIKPFDNQLSLDDLDAIKLIGKGRSGIVQLVRHKWTGQLFALKVIQVNFHEAIHRQIVQELKISLSTECPYVVTCCQCFNVYGAISIVLEYMDGGSLSDFLKTVKTIPEFYLAAICKQVLRGLVYLHHERCIMHRNLKPSNILINHRGEVKISDFGVCAIISGSSGEQGTFTSTVNYMAPEIISGQKHGYMNDFWSLGLVMLECATGNFPYPARESFYELLEALVDQPPPSASPEQFSKEFCSFISACIQMDARDRSSAQILLGHPFLSMFDDLNVDLASYFTTIRSPLATTDIYKVPDGKQETGADAVGP